ncbi:hypothetical protein ACFTAO_13075 [Paenibacillus rhizoplanae]
MTNETTNETTNEPVNGEAEAAEKAMTEENWNELLKAVFFITAL